MHNRVARTGLVAAALLLAGATSPAARAAGLTHEERREVAGLLRQFAGRGVTREERDRIADRVLEIGDYAPDRLRSVAERLFTSLLPRYAKAYYGFAGRTYEARLRRLGLSRRDTLRRQIWSVVRSQGLTKEKVLEEADPALEELEAALLLTRDAVLEANSRLVEQREELLQLVVIVRRCRDAAGKEPANAAVGGEADGEDPALATLRAQEQLAGLLVLAEGNRDHAQVLTENVPLERQIRPEEVRGIRRLNALRLLLGVRPLAIDVKLCLACRDHSKDMAEKGFFSHDSPVPGKARFSDRARNFGTTAGGENIHKGSTDGPDAITSWWHSPGHLKNMMRGWSRTGLGHYEKHWTQLFGG